MFIVINRQGGNCEAPIDVVVVTPNAGVDHFVPDGWGDPTRLAG
jgi:hypothetical protein